MTLPILGIYCGVVGFSQSGESPVSSIQTYIGSAFSSYPVRWIESPETSRSRSAIDQISQKPLEKAVDPDRGKPHSASGDVLDLSLATQKALGVGKSDTENADKRAEIIAKTAEKLPTGGELTPEELQQVDELKARDLEVRNHEMAHVMAGGAFVTGGPSYEYQIGPDGKGYAVGGSVGIDTSPIANDPEATIAKMQTVAAAALAPASPSGQDLKVAAAARQAEAKARAELTQVQTQQPEESEEQPENSENASPFAIVKSADRMAGALAKSDADSAMPSPSKASSDFAPSSAYKAQSVATLAVSRFSAFA